LAGKPSTASQSGDLALQMESKGKGKAGISHGLSKLKRGWEDKREERKLEKEFGSIKITGEREAELDWGDDAGREEEGRVLDMLEAKWMKMNDTVSLTFVFFFWSPTDRPL
jgi:transcription initiation factor TFIID subunit 3